MHRPWAAVPVAILRARGFIERAGRIVHVGDPAVRIGHDDSFLDRVEDRLDEPLLLRELEQIILDVLRPDPPESFDEFVEKTGLHEIADFRLQIAD